MGMTVYREARPLIRDADILLFSGNGFVSTAIERVTHSEYSHVELAESRYGRIMSLGAVGVGVRYQPLSLTLRQGDYTRVDVYRLKPGIPFDSDALFRFAFANLGKPYAFLNLVGIWANETLNVSGLINSPRIKDTDAFICSGFVSRGYTAGGRDLRADVNDPITTPEQIGESQFIEKILAFEPGEINETD
jgi:hypothetical protein